MGHLGDKPLPHFPGKPLNRALPDTEEMECRASTRQPDRLFSGQLAHRVAQAIFRLPRELQAARNTELVHQTDALRPTRLIGLVP